MFLILILSCNAHAVDQQWLSLQADHQLSSAKKISLNFHRRDRGDLFKKRLLNVYRIHYTISKGDWNIILGGAYFDQESGTIERRLHQYAERKMQIFDKDFISSFIRLGLEERQFNSDNFLYLRLRFRALMELVPEESLGPCLYHETFYVPSGQNRFSSTLNEHRTGFGLRYSLQSTSFLLFHTYNFLRTPEATRYEQWWQLLVSFPI